MFDDGADGSSKCVCRGLLLFGVNMFAQIATEVDQRPINLSLVELLHPLMALLLLLFALLNLILTRARQLELFSTFYHFSKST